MPTPSKNKTGSYTEYQIMYEKNSDDTTRLYYITADSVESAIREFRLTHVSEEILNVVKL
ncbi:MAG TPA: hypothetical protein PK605_00265 [Ignavibacteria bacterium]|nr:hypothetical protein [Bacteroidota bacterium]HRE10786.1 hypothetical protein [Ignavibacteria bacterium]HRF65971.1 hypothetical protein [Ignavibacteria bacterium]HRJ02812.1 hypothetical protein [Ignavibacteria bacterium]HRJ84370.1 hypothetical protein [Ignavibacteria bacterium]